VIGSRSTTYVRLRHEPAISPARSLTGTCCAPGPAEWRATARGSAAAAGRKPAIAPL
jgi:hypothetical protein